jgi:hypothetical protein
LSSTSPRSGARIWPMASLHPMSSMALISPLVPRQNVVPVLLKE